MSEASGHVLVFPYPFQGHINPMIQLSKRLSKKGVTVTLIIASNNHREPYTSDDYSITVHTIHDGFLPHEHPQTKFNEPRRFINSTTRSLTDFISREKLTSNPPKALIYDPFMPFAMDVAKDLGLYVVAYFTQPWLASLVYYHINEGTYDVPDDRHDNPTFASFPAFPLLSQNDLPSFAREKGSYPLLFELLVSQFCNLRRADLILCNTFDQLEPKVVKWMSDQWPVKNIGPAVPSKFLDNRLPEDKDYDLGDFQTEPDESVLRWLASKPARSVVYVAFGIFKNNDESENTTWILANTKPCPKCKRQIEKNLGCNHMTCSGPCYFEFCWICLRAFPCPEDCNKFTGGDEAKSKREMAKAALDRYMHYYERWASNQSSRLTAKSDLEMLQSVQLKQLSDKQDTPETQLQFIVDAWLQIIECRRVLKWTFAYGYYLPQHEHAKKRFFEYLQGDAQVGLERLHHCAEVEFKQFLSETEDPSSDFSDFRMKLTSLTKVTKTYFENLVKALENGLADVEQMRA